MIVAHNNQSSQPSIPVNPVQQCRCRSNKNTKKKADCGGNQYQKTSKDANKQTNKQKKNWVML